MVDKAGSSRPLSGLVDLLFLFPSRPTCCALSCSPRDWPLFAITCTSRSIRPTSGKREKLGKTGTQTIPTTILIYRYISFARTVGFATGDRKRNSISVTNLDFFFIFVLFSLIYSLISLSLDLSILQSTHPSIHPSIYLSIYLSIQPVCLSVLRINHPPLHPAPTLLPIIFFLSNHNHISDHV